MTSLNVVRSGLTVGIDPGKSGALAWLDPQGQLVHVEDMPDATGVALGALIRDLLVERTPTAAWVEKVGYMPGQQGGWTFAENYGVILGALGAWDVPTNHVSAAVWKKAAGLTKRKGETGPETKRRSRQRAIEQWPASSALFARQRDEGRSEAALIGLHGLTTATFSPLTNGVVDA